MKGIITYYSKLEDKGSIQSEDGKIYSFTSKDCERDFTLSDIKEPVDKFNSSYRKSINKCYERDY